jgi:hypothetical protein
MALFLLFAQRLDLLKTIDELLLSIGDDTSRKAFNKRSLRSKQLATRGQTLTCAFRRSGIGGLDLLTTTITGFDLLGLGRWWVGQSRILIPGWQLLCAFHFRLSDWRLRGWSS